AADKAQAFTRPRVERDHWVQQQAAAYALADRTQAALMALAGSEIEFGRVLDRKDMPAGHRRSGSGAPPLNQAVQRFLRVTQQPAKPDLGRLVALRQPAKATGTQMHHAFEEQRPPLSRRRSPNRPR